MSVKQKGGLGLAGGILVVAVVSLIDPQAGAATVDGLAYAFGFDFAPTTEHLPDLAGLMRRDDLLGHLAGFGFGAALAAGLASAGQRAAGRLRA